MPFSLRILYIKQYIFSAYVRYLTRRLRKTLDRYEKTKQKYESYIISRKEHLNKLAGILENKQESLNDKANKYIEELNTRRIIKFKGEV